MNNSDKIRDYFKDYLNSLTRHRLKQLIGKVIKHKKDISKMNSYSDFIEDAFNGSNNSMKFKSLIEERRFLIEDYDSIIFLLQTIYLLSKQKEVSFRQSVYNQYVNEFTWLIIHSGLEDEFMKFIDGDDNPNGEKDSSK